MRKKRSVKAYKSVRVIGKTSKPNYGKKFYFIISIGVLLVLSLSAINIFRLYGKSIPQTKEVLAQSRDIYHERDFWIKFLETTPDYLPGLTELSKIEYETGNTDVANELLGKAKFINPNDVRVKETEEFLRGSK